MGWEYSRGNRARTSYNPDGSTSLATPGWTYTLTSGHFFTSAPIVSVNGFIYFGESSGGYNGRLTSLNPDGTLRWSVSLDIASGHVRAYELGSNAAGQVFFCTPDWPAFMVFNEDGTLAFEHHDLNSAGSCPVCADDGTFYVSDTDGNYNWNIRVYASSGSLLHTYVPSLGAYGQAQQGCMAMLGTSLYVVSDNDPEADKFTTSGGFNWDKYPLTNGFNAYGAIAVYPLTGNSFVISRPNGGSQPAHTDSNLYCLKSSDGTELWHYEGLTGNANTDFAAPL